MKYGFVIIDQTKNKFIGVDSNSGGYPTYTDFLGSAKIWISTDKAWEYIQIFGKNISDNSSKWVVKSLNPNI